MAEPEISLFFPVYKDENTVERVARKGIDVLSKLAQSWELIIINDGSPDRSGAIADGLARENPNVRVIHHPKNLGYGVAIRRGLSEARGKWICFTDGDDEYDVYEFLHLYKLKDFYDLIITFRYKKLYSSKRIFISYVYNWILRRIFRTRYRDISTGLRAINKTLASELALQSDSPFIGAEIAIKSQFKGFRVGEVGIQTFPREFGRGNSVTGRNIFATLSDMFKVHKEIFSDNYALPGNRSR